MIPIDRLQEEMPEEALALFQKMLELLDEEGVILVSKFKSPRSQGYIFLREQKLIDYHPALAADDMPYLTLRRRGKLLQKRLG